MRVIIELQSDIWGANARSLNIECDLSFIAEGFFIRPIDFKSKHAISLHLLNDKLNDPETSLWRVHDIFLTRDEIGEYYLCTAMIYTDD